MSKLSRGLPPDVEPDSPTMYAIRSIPVLAARLADEPWPAWLCELWDEGRLWRDGRGYHAGSGGGRIDLDPDEFIVLDAAGELRTCHPETFGLLFERYEPATLEVEADDVVLGTVYREGGTRFLTGYVRGWSTVRWELSTDPDGEGLLRVFAWDLTPGEGPRDVWATDVRIDPGLVRDAMGKSGPATRTPAQRELAEIIADILSEVDASVVVRGLLEEFERQRPLPRGKRR